MLRSYDVFYITSNKMTHICSNVNTIFMYKKQFSFFFIINLMIKQNEHAYLIRDFSLTLEFIDLSI